MKIAKSGSCLKQHKAGREHDIFTHHVLKLDADRCNIDSKVQLNGKVHELCHLGETHFAYREHGQEERPEVIEHFGEEVPPQPCVRC